MSKLVTTVYNISKNLNIKLAIVADLHDTNPKEILLKLQKEKPDLILVPGDLLERINKEMCFNDDKKNLISYKIAGTLSKSINGLAYLFPTMQIKDKKNINYGRLFLRKAKKIAPVIVSNGNHEMYYSKKDLLEFKDDCKLLLNEDTSINIKGKEILLGGLSSNKDLKWLKEFSKKDGFKILLCHHPEYYDEIKKVTNNKIDLIISGHTHGGQWIFFGIPLFAPGVGILPKYAHGLYDDKLIVSSGCSNTVNLPRFNNPKELVIINI